MQFLPDVYVTCEVCEGARYNREALDITYKGKTIADVLAMTVEEAHVFFQNIPSIERKLGTLVDVGLGYIRLGQPATTLSGGEAQRIKLAAELSKRATGKTVYILDEPTTGLHFADTRKLIQVLQRLADAGNTVIVIEHNLDVIKSADWLIDLGPEGGDAGGELIAEGTPEDVANQPASYTGQYLQRVLNPDTRRPRPSSNGRTRASSATQDWEPWQQPARAAEQGPRDCVTHIEGLRGNHGTCNSSIRGPRSGRPRDFVTHMEGQATVAPATRRFEDRGAVVTGGATGIGGAIAERLASEGASVLIADINAQGAQERAARIQDAGGIAAACTTNVGELDQVQAMIQAAVDRWGRLDIIVNNAYPALEAMTGGAEDVPPDVYDRAMAVLVKASYLSAKFGVPHLRSAGGGSIVNISSIHGLLVAPGALVYETGKAALIAATRQMAVEYGRDGIRVNAIAPGHIVTEGIQAGLWDQNPSGLKFLEAQYPVGRCGRPADIAAAVAFLCSEDASFITGHTLVVDGGHSLQIQENFGVAQAQYIKDHPHTQLPY